MSLNLEKSTWKRVRLRDVIRRSRTQVDPLSSGVERYVGGGHIDSEGVTIERWGHVDDGQMGSTFRYVFGPGQLLFVSARPYLRKIGVPDFSGVVADKTYVLDALPENGLLQDFLPFVLSSDAFIEFATAEATGSMNPRLLWGPMQRYEFDLPPLDDQRRLADLLWAVEWHMLALVETGNVLASTESTLTRDALVDLDWSLRLSDAVRSDRPLCYGVVQPGVDVEEGVGLVRVMDLESGAPRRGDLKNIVPEVDLQYRRSRIVAGDVLVSIVGTIGRTWVVTEEFEGCNIARALARVSPDPEAMSPDFLAWVLSSDQLQSTLDTAAFESARKTLNLSALADVALPRISVAEQKALLSRRAELLVARSKTAAEVDAVKEIRKGLLLAIFGGAT